jgi:hypothetical protein
MKLLLLLLLAGLASGQQTFDARFALIKNTTLAGAAEKITIQQPASGAKRVRILSVTAYCSVSCTVTLSRDGTAASGTALAPVSISGNGAATTVSGYHTSNAGSGTVISIPFRIAAGGTVSVEVPGVDLIGSGTTKNFSVTTSSITGDVSLQIIWREE